MNEVEKMARAIAAKKMGLVKDPFGLRLPDDLWHQAIPLAERELDAEALSMRLGNLKTWLEE